MPMQLRENISIARKLPRTDVVLLGRSAFLGQEDRDLIEAVLVRGQPAALVARMTGTTAKAVRRRVHRISRRLSSRKFLDTVRALPYLPEEESLLARLFFCRGVPQRQIAQQMNITEHALRRRLDRLAAQITAITRWRTSKTNP
jgi:DNA-directed RNA polymerase specialized sigma24 family protein